MKVLITGSGGQVGRALLRSVPNAVSAHGLSRSDLDLTDSNAITKAFEQYRPDLVINAAAYTAVDRAEQEEEQAFQVNALAVEALAKACAKHSARLLHISTDFVFDGASSTPYKPGSNPAPQSVYGRSKLAGEQAVLASPNNLLVRTAWVYSGDGHNFVQTMLKLMGEKDDLRVVSDQIGTPTHASSLARGLWALVQAEAKGILHYTDTGVASWYDFAIAIQEEACALGLLKRQIPILPITTIDYPTPARRPPYSVLDKSETWRMIGEPAQHWRVELREMLRAEKDQHG